MNTPEEHQGSQGSPSRWPGRLTEFSLRRRVTVFVLLMSILVVGFVATTGIPLELVPRGYTGQNLYIWVPWQNAPTQEVMDKIALPLEQELSTVHGLDRLVSRSSLGRGNVYMRFKRGTDMDVAYREVRDRVQRARLQFPDDVDRVFIRKDDASGVPVGVIGIVIDPTLVDHYTLIKREVLERLERIDGVANVSTDGFREKEILIELDRRKTEAHGLNIYQLAQQLGGDNFTMASGTVRDSGKKFLLRSIASYSSLEELENRPVTPTIRLKDIARIKYEEPEKRFSVRVNSRPAFAAVIHKEGEANTVEVSRRIQAAFEEMQENPRLSTIYMEILFTQGEVIEDSLTNLVRGGLIGGTMAALVLFIFLRRIRLTGIVTLAIPLSMLMALTVMYFAGETLNILTILALVIAVGMLVDNSVVVSENIHRMHSEGRSRRDACVLGAGEIALAITMATLTTIVVFVPVALVEGEGQFFLMRLALPISVSLLASLLVALVFIPLSVYLTLPANDSRKQHAVVRWSHERLNAVMQRLYDSTFGRLNRLYCRWLGFFLKRRLDLVLLLLIVFGLTVAVPFQHVDVVEQQEEDQSSFQIRVDASNEYSFEDVGDYFGDVEALMERRKEEYGLKGYIIFYRQRGGRLEGWFDDTRTMEFSAKEIGAKIVEELPRKPGLKIRYGRENEMDDGKGSEVFTLRLEGDDPGMLADVAAQLEPAVMGIEGVLGIRPGDEPMPNEMALVVHRERTTVSSVDPQVIAGLVGYALRGSSLPKFNKDGREIPVRIRFQEEDRESLSDLAGFRVPAEGGASIPLSALTRSRVLESPKTIRRVDKRVSRRVTVELEKDGAKETRERLKALQRRFVLPEGVSFSEFRVRTQQEEIASMIFAAQLSVLFIYLLMGFLFESFILPLSIISTIPLASIGVGWVHYLTGRDMDFLGFVGGILLIGVVVNNGIVFIDYVNRLRAGGLDRTRALLTAAERRFRPICMTALTTIVGMIPLTFSGPTQMGISYKSFGLTLIGGMTTATLLTLLVVPVFYTFFDDARRVLMRTLRNSLAPRETATRTAAEKASTVQKSGELASGRSHACESVE